VQKALVAVRDRGGQVQVQGFFEDWHEAHWVAGQIAEAIVAGIPGPEIVILARTGYATQAVQLSLARAGIPHRVLGSLGLYERAEVKDAVAYLTLLVNPRDAQAFRRAIQSPRRGVGPATASKVVTRAEELDGDLLVACTQVDEIDGVRCAEARRRLAAFGEGMSTVRCELDAGRSLGHVVVSAVMLDGELVHHFEQRRDTSPNAAARQDAERVLEDLRSLCRAAQAVRGTARRVRLAPGFPRALGRAARPGARRRRGPPRDHLHDPPRQRDRGDAGDPAGLRGAAAPVLAIAGLAGSRGAL
jgi:DNA helicase-2/ATP-dependent DNA helicase PcrA